jgi:ABC-2 type transport system permease protein
MVLEYIKINFKTSLEYRTSFIIQIVSMIVNNFIWLLFWFVFFDNFKLVNGYVFKDMLLIYGLAATAYGFAGLFAQNRKQLATMINQGRLDYYLTLPKNILFHISTSGFSAYAFGDLIFGFFVLSMFIFEYSIFLIALFVFTGMLLLISIDLIGSSIAFYIGNSERLSSTIHNASVTFAIYPIGVFADWARILLVTVIPVAFISAIPLEILKSFSIELMFLTILVVIIIFVISILFFYYGLKRYESGNLLYVRN